MSESTYIVHVYLLFIRCTLLYLFFTWHSTSIPYIPVYTTVGDCLHPIEVCVGGVQQSGAVKPVVFSRTMGVKYNVSNFRPIFVETDTNL